MESRTLLKSFTLIFCLFSASVVSADEMIDVMNEIAQFNGIQGHYARRTMDEHKSEEKKYEYGHSKSYRKKHPKQFTKYSASVNYNAYSGKRLDVSSTQWSQVWESSFHSNHFTGIRKGPARLQNVGSVSLQIGIDNQNKKAILLTWENKENEEQSFLALPQKDAQGNLSIFIPDIADSTGETVAYGLAVQEQPKLRVNLIPRTSLPFLTKDFRVISYKDFKSIKVSD